MCPVGYLLVPLGPLGGVAFSEGARMLRNGNAHTRPAQGTGTKSIRHTHLRPLALTKRSWVERARGRGRSLWQQSSCPSVSPTFRLRR
jgi:hypothetical protein